MGNRGYFDDRKSSSCDKGHAPSLAAVERSFDLDHALTTPEKTFNQRLTLYIGGTEWIDFRAYEKEKDIVGTRTR